VGVEDYFYQTPDIKTTAFPADVLGITIVMSEHSLSFNYNGFKPGVALFFKSKLLTFKITNFKESKMTMESN
jgi:hypothetical protein